MTIQSAKYFDLVNQTLQFTPQELDYLQRNGFFVSDRLAFEQFKRAYAYLYWKDLPVLITTDSLLHALHQTYDKMLKELEVFVLVPKLAEILRILRATLREASKNAEPRLAPVYADLDLYLSVPLARLLRDGKHELSEDAQKYLAMISRVNSHSYHNGRGDYDLSETGKLKWVDLPEIGVEQILLFGSRRKVDFTLFQARGHYDEPELVNYFTAMIWLTLIDFRFVEYDDEGRVNPSQLAAAHLLRDALDQANLRSSWEEIELILTGFIGWGDAITLHGLDALLDELNVKTPVDYFTADPDTLLKTLSKQSSGSLRGAALSGDNVRPPLSFALIASRYTLETYLIEQVVYDQLVIDGQQVLRGYPSALDVLYALGNTYAAEHLTDEFARYNYRTRLDELQQYVKTISSEFWENSLYNLWLNTIRALNEAPQGELLPNVFRSAAWADKTLQTQLASWAQLRHDNILYVKPPFSPTVVCEYPAGYVEPYPAFYAALAAYARFGQGLFASVDAGTPPEMTYEQALKHQFKDWAAKNNCMDLHRRYYTYERIRNYFIDLEATATRLETMAQKELANQPFDEQETLFLRSVVVRKYIGAEGYGGHTEEHWDGWYTKLLPFDDENPAIVADVFTNLDARIAPVGVLHIGTGMPAMVALVVDHDDGQTIYVGPAFTYFEQLRLDDPPHRLLDSEWISQTYLGDPNTLLVHLEEGKQELEQYRERLNTMPADHPERRSTAFRIRRYEQDLQKAETILRQAQIAAPNWMSSFRLTTPDLKMLELPSAWDDLDLPADLRKQLGSLAKEIHAKQDKVFSWGAEIAALVDLLRETPDAVLQLMSVEAREALIAKLRAKGHWDRYQPRN
jgi:hypothetical protein